MGVTIGIPFYNAEEYLEMAIKSVFAQTYKDWELLLVDDGSTDNSLAIAKSINDPRVTVISDGKNKKLAARLNEIVQLANHEYLARMDADDLIATTRIEKQMKVLKENPDLDLTSAGCISITNDQEYLGSRGKNVLKISFEDVLLKRASPIHACIVAKTTWFKRNTYNESLKIAQDQELFLSATKKNDFSIRLLSDRLYFYREENNATAKKVLAAYKNERQMLKKFAPKSYYYKLWAKSMLKSLVVRVLTILGKEHLLLKRRYNGLIDVNEKEYFLREVEKIKNTELPFF